MSTITVLDPTRRRRSEHRRLGPVPRRPDLVSVLVHDWQLLCARALAASWFADLGLGDDPRELHDSARRDRHLATRLLLLARSSHEGSRWAAMTMLRAVLDDLLHLAEVDPRIDVQDWLGEAWVLIMTMPVEPRIDPCRGLVEACARSIGARGAPWAELPAPPSELECIEQAVARPSASAGRRRRVPGVDCPRCHRGRDGVSGRLGAVA
ncbi:hypothetical protein [Acidipropionibacterium timonense]|uniref:hypothetical protein n=1 Tax=Acidipropionibacterium timonense TaxID=2161818 RepID=UPI00103223A3|nr:hypothetical protein [Acidipropionibacterium timonense]